MKYRFLESLVVITVVSLASTSAAGQSTVKSKAWTQPRTPDGQPDLQGIWSNATTTPLERPAAMAGKQVLTDEETIELQKQTSQNRNTDRRGGIGTSAVSGRCTWEIGSDGRTWRAADTAASESSDRRPCHPPGPKPMTRRER